MEDARKRREAVPQRRYQCSRLEDQTWEMAYELIWSVVRKALQRELESTTCHDCDPQTMSKGT